MHDPLENNTPDPTPQPPPNPVPPPPQASEPPPPIDDLPNAEEKQWAMFAHLSALAGGLLTSAVGGWGVFIGPLAIWLIKKDTMKFVDDQGKEALNFNITVAIACFALLLLSIVTLGVGLILAIPLWFVIGIGWLVLTIIAAVKSSNGEFYRYPMTLRLVK
jgi:uncharacterized Tic20 family protein